MPHISETPKQVLIAFDQLCNTLAGGWADETFSARCWRKREDSAWWGWGRRIVDALFFWDGNHCRESYESEVNRSQLPPSMRPE